jgi:hypothetical protein
MAICAALGQINENSGDAAKISATVDRYKEQGADLAKVFATASIRDGGKTTMTVDQINVAEDSVPLHYGRGSGCCY